MITMDIVLPIFFILIGILLGTKLEKKFGCKKKRTIEDKKLSDDEFEELLKTEEPIPNTEKANCNYCDWYLIVPKGTSKREIVGMLDVHRHEVHKT
jgi:hypothetical protein